MLFDPCAGSGRHLLEAKKSKRKYLEIEIHKPYFNLIQEQLKGEWKEKGYGEYAVAEIQFFTNKIVHRAVWI